MDVDLSQVFGTFCCVLDTFSIEARKKMSERITTVSGKMKELFQVLKQADKLVEEAIAENLKDQTGAKAWQYVNFFIKKKPLYKKSPSFICMMQKYGTKLVV